MLTAMILLLVKTVIIPAFGAASTWLIAEATKWVRAKTGSETAATSLMVLDDVIGVVTKELQQTRTNPAKAAGTLTEQTASDIKAEAVSKVKAYLGTDGLNKMVGALQLDQGKAVALIESKIEAAVFHTKTPPPPAGTQADKPDVRLPPPPMPASSTQDFAPSAIEVLTTPRHTTPPTTPAAPAPPLPPGPQIAAPLPAPPQGSEAVGSADAPPAFLHPDMSK